MTLSGRLAASLVMMISMASSLDAARAAIPKVKIVIASQGLKVAAEVFWDVAKDCTSLGLGTITSSTPKYGTLILSVEPLQIPAGFRCQGSTLPASVAYYVWTSGGAKDSAETFMLHYVSRHGERKDVSVLAVLPARLAKLSAGCTTAVSGSSFDPMHSVFLSLQDQNAKTPARAVAFFGPKGGLRVSRNACAADKITGFAWHQTIDYIPRYFGQPDPMQPTTILQAPPAFSDSIAGPASDLYYPLQWPRAQVFQLSFHERLAPRRLSADAGFCPAGSFQGQTAAGEDVLCYTDFPTMGGVAAHALWQAQHSLGAMLTDLMVFTTSLVGILADGQITAPIAQWVWKDTFSAPVNPFAIPARLPGRIEILSKSGLVRGP